MVQQIIVEESFDKWRSIARILLTQKVHYTKVHFLGKNDAQTQLFSQKTLPESQNDSKDCGGELYKISTPRTLLSLLELAAYYNDSDKWNLFYRIVWRVNFESCFLSDNFADPDIHRLHMMRKSISRAIHKMHAFVRFKKVFDSELDEDVYIAWFEPEHDIAEACAPFFITRFPGMRWSIFTPHSCIHWDRESLTVSPGVSGRDMNMSDEIELLWETYYCNIYNPARLNSQAMLAEMPKKYWKNLPEARLISDLVRDSTYRG